MLKAIVIVLLLVPVTSHAVHPVIIDDVKYLNHFKLNGALEFNKSNNCFSAEFYFPEKIAYGEEYENFTKKFGRAGLIRLAGKPNFDSLSSASFYAPLMFHNEGGNQVIRNLCIPEADLSLMYIELYYGSGNQPPTIYYVPLVLLSVMK